MTEKWGDGRVIRDDKIGSIVNATGGKPRLNLIEKIVSDWYLLVRRRIEEFGKREDDA